MSARRWFFTAAALAAASLAQAESRAGGPDLVLVLNAKNGESPDLATAKRIVVGDMMYWKGNVPVHLFVRPAGAAPGDTFFRTMQIAPARFRRLWQEKQLSGQGSIPETVPAVAGVLAKVASDPGAMGIALSDEVPASSPDIRIVPIH